MNNYNIPFQQEDKIIKLLDLCLQVQRTGKANAFFNLSGHVQKVMVAIHMPCWQYRVEPTHRFECYRSEVDEAPEDGTTLDEAINKIEALVKSLS